MAMDQKTTNTVIGVILIVLGILFLTGRFLSVGPLIWIAAVVALVVGILMLLNVLSGNRNLAIGLVIAGAVVLILPRFASAVSDILNIVVGVLLILVGIMKLMNKW